MDGKELLSQDVRNYFIFDLLKILKIIIKVF